VSQSLPSPMPPKSKRSRETPDEPIGHHYVYVVELDLAVRNRRGLQRLNPDADPEKPCVYVGMTGIAPEERFEHKAGHRASRVVWDFGVRLRPELNPGLTDMTCALAARAEAARGAMRLVGVDGCKAANGRSHPAGSRRPPSSQNSRTLLCQELSLC
jgi:hypothetical protein